MYHLLLLKPFQFLLILLLLNYLILIKEITILYIMAAVWLIMDITIYHSFFLSPLMLGLTPVSTFAYYLLAGCVDYIRISPAYAKTAIR